MKKVTRVTKGLRFRHVFADSNALWEVKRSRGAGVWVCEIVDEPIEINGQMYPSDWAGRQDVFTSEKILAIVNTALAWEAKANEDDRWFASQLGRTVHYHNGFGAYVRCIVVDEEKSGVRFLCRPLALVGNWRPHELPRRMRDGSVYLGYHAEKIAVKKTWRPSAGCIYEYPHFAAPRGDDQQGDPRKMKPIDLTVPDMTPEEARRARLWQTVDAVHEAMKVGNNADPQKLLEAARDLISKALSDTDG